MLKSGIAKVWALILVWTTVWVVSSVTLCTGDLGLPLAILFGLWCSVMWLIPVSQLILWRWGTDEEFQHYLEDNW
jgi:hypothetical protein